MTGRRHLCRKGDPLSARESEVLPLLAEGLHDSEIASKIFASTHTVKSHVVLILVKLGARNRTHAVALAYERRLLVPEGEVAA